jgi:hypothetical protein
MPSMDTGQSAKSKKSKSWMLPAVGWPLRSVNRSIVLTVWTMSSGPAATHGSGGSVPALAWPSPLNGTTDPAAGAPDEAAWTAAGGVTAVAAGARSPRPASAVPRSAWTFSVWSGLWDLLPCFVSSGRIPSPWTVGWRPFWFAAAGAVARAAVDDDE